MISWRRFKAAPFLWRLTRARFAEIEGRFEEARKRLRSIEAPEEYVSLRDAYDARLASIAYAKEVTSEGLERHPPVEMRKLISKARTASWYRQPKDDNQRYASRFIDYLEAAVVLADGQKRSAIADELQQAGADALFKKVLLAT